MLTLTLVLVLLGLLCFALVAFGPLLGVSSSKVNPTGAGLFLWLLAWAIQAGIL